MYIWDTAPSLFHSLQAQNSAVPQMFIPAAWDLNQEIINVKLKVCTKLALNLG